MSTQPVYENPQPEKAGEYCDNLNIPYSAVFVPQSQSRNAGENLPSLNWRVTFGAITTDYMQGIAHMPGYVHKIRRTVNDAQREENAAERGIVGIKPLPKPKLVDVLYSLVMDADVLEYGCFEDWATYYGYSEDSREAEKIYRQCLDIALELRQLIDLDEAREAFEGY